MTANRKRLFVDDDDYAAYLDAPRTWHQQQRDLWAAESEPVSPRTAGPPPPAGWGDEEAGWGSSAGNRRVLAAVPRRRRHAGGGGGGGKAGLGTLLADDGVAEQENADVPIMEAGDSRGGGGDGGGNDFGEAEFLDSRFGEVEMGGV